MDRLHSCDGDILSRLCRNRHGSGEGDGLLGARDLLDDGRFLLPLGGRMVGVILEHARAEMVYLLDGQTKFLENCWDTVFLLLLLYW